MTAWGRTTQNCQMLVPSPMDGDLTSASGWIMLFFDEFVVVADVVGFGVDVGGEDEADGAGGEVVEGSPDTGDDVESLVGAVEEKCALDFAVVEGYGEAARGGYNELAEVAVGVAAAGFAAGDVVEIIGAFDVEGHCQSVFHYAEVAFAVAVMAAELYHGAVVDF